MDPARLELIRFASHGKYTAELIAEVERLQVTIAHMANVITWEELCKFFDLDPADYIALAKIDDIRQVAIEAGKELAR